MDQPEQALAYAQADFAAPHEALVGRFAVCFPAVALRGNVVDLGCGPADFTLRMAQAWPDCAIDGIDASRAMLELGAERIRQAGLQARVRLHHRHLPSKLPRSSYQAVISNSLLHHLHDASVLWDTVLEALSPGGLVFVCDLYRPASTEVAAGLVERYSAGEPELLRRDFYRSLLAAFRPEEVRQQLAETPLAGLRVETTSDRHMVISGYR